MPPERIAVSWIAETDAALKLAKNASEVERQVADLSEASESLGGLLTELEGLVAGASVLRPLGWAGTGTNPELQSNFEEAARTLGSRPLNRLARSLTAFEASARKGLLECWSQHAAERLGNLSELQTLAGTLGEVRSLQNLSRRLEDKIGYLARTQLDVPSIESVRLLEEAEQILEELEESLQPDSVRRFLSAVARGGAPLEYLTADVTDWLIGHGAGNGFKIVAGGSTTETSND